jgi:hypothetical protein
LSHSGDSYFPFHFVRAVKLFQSLHAGDVRLLLFPLYSTALLKTLSHFSFSWLLNPPNPSSLGLYLIINELPLSTLVMTLPNILLASFVFLSWLSYSFSILTTEEPKLEKERSIKLSPDRLRRILKKKGLFGNERGRATKENKKS